MSPWPGFGYCGEQRYGVRVTGIREQLVGGALFNDMSQVHHCYAVRDLTYNREIMRDKQVRQAPVLLEIGEEVEHLGLH